MKVVELAHVASGPFAGMLLADLGADVVKIESAAGDMMRGWPPVEDGPDGSGFSHNFASLNRNKRSVMLDLKDPADIETARGLIGAADVLVENFRPGALDRLGLGFEDARRVNDHIVYCSVSGYGHASPFATRAAFDVAVQGVSGLMSVTGEEEGIAVKCGVPVADFVAGLYAVVSILAALRSRDRDSQAVRVDCAMVGALLGISALQTSEFFGTGRAPRRLGTAHPRNAPYQAFQASDRPFVMAAGNDRMWADLCSLLSLEDLVDDERFATQAVRAANHRELAEILGAEFTARSADEWIAALDEAGIACAPVNDFAEALEDPTVVALDLLRDLHLPNGVETKTVAYPVGMSTHDFAVYRDPPELGADTDTVLAEWLGATEPEDKT
ncbi:MAG: CoA transferase [Acidimicrobiales bacterium]